MKRAWLLLVLIFLFTIAAGCSTSPNEGIKTAPKKGAYAPEFTLINTAGEEVSLSSQRGKVVLINFWATWCPPCLQEMPGIQSRYEMHKENFSVLAVNDGDPQALVVEFRDRVGLTFEPLIDTRGSVGQLYQISAFPTSMFVDEHGIIQIVHIGLMTEAQLDSYLVNLGVGVQTSSK